MANEIVKSLLGNRYRSGRSSGAMENVIQPREIEQSAEQRLNSEITYRGLQSLYGESSVRGKITGAVGDVAADFIRSDRGRQLLFGSGVAPEPKTPFGERTGVKAAVTTAKFAGRGARGLGRLFSRAAKSGYEAFKKKQQDRKNNIDGEWHEEVTS